MTIEKEVKKNKSKFWDKLYRYRAYALRGHSSWFLYLVWAISNISIIYVLLGSQIPILYQLFPNIIFFGLIFSVIYIILATLLGYWDYTRGTFAQEVTIIFKNNPEWIELRADVNELKSLKELIQKVIDKLEEV